VEGQIVHLKGWRYFQEHHRHHQQQQQQLLLIKPYDLIQFRIVSEIIYQFGHFVGLSGRGISLTQGLYIYRTAQHKKARTNILALSGIRTPDPSIKAAMTHALDRAGTVIGTLMSTW
jgi:hypothetical protein